jgi:hypothetical protein
LKENSLPKCCMNFLCLPPELFSNFPPLDTLQHAVLGWPTYITRSRDSSVSIVSDYGLDNQAIGVRFPAGAKDFSSSLCVQTGSGAHPASCPMVTGGPFPGSKRAAVAWC